MPVSDEIAPAIEEQQQSIDITNNNHVTPPSLTISQRMASACIGSIATSLVVTPFDVVRVRLQQQSSVYPSISPAFLTRSLPQGYKLIQTPSSERIPLSRIGLDACCKDVISLPNNAMDQCIASTIIDDCAEKTAPKRFIGTWEGITKIAKNEGIYTLWRGLSLTLIMAVPNNMVYFTGYEFLKEKSLISNQFLNPLLCGGFARILAATTISPLELLRTRLQSIPKEKPLSSQQQFLNTINDTKYMIKSEGVGFLFRGLVLTLWRDVPFSGIYWASYEFFKKKLSNVKLSDNNGNETFLKAFIAGSLSGTIAAIVTNPFDVGKTRKQVASQKDPTFASLKMVPLLRHIVKTEGFGALYIGAIPRILKIAPSCAIMISSYEVSKKIVATMNEKKRLSHGPEFH